MATRHANPFADLGNDALLKQIRTMDEHDAAVVAAIPDPAYLAHARREVLAAAAIATLLAAPNLSTPVMDDVYIDPSLCVGPWLNALADELYADGGQ